MVEPLYVCARLQNVAGDCVLSYSRCTCVHQVHIVLKFDAIIGV